jgi:hypothetical protein
MSYLDNTGLAYFWSKLKALFATKQDTLVSGTNIKTVNNQSLLGTGNITAGIDDVTSPQDGTILITLSNGDVVTVDLNHNHPQYPKYVHLEDESDMPASPETDTMYLIDGEGGSGGGGTYTLPAASSSALGGIKTGYTQSGQNYPVALDANNAAYVNVPFTNIVYLTSESAMPASPDSNTLYVILES